MMTPPGFWLRPEGANHPLARLLSPVSAAYGATVRRKLQRDAAGEVPCPVICVGNVTMGGVGKTPFVDFLADKCADRGAAPVILSRGYGGSLRGPVLASPTHSAAEIGDEPVMLAKRWPVVVSRDRLAGAFKAVEHGAEIIVMDDGFQNPSVHKSLSFLMVDAEMGLGNGRLFPAGPLRERPEDALDRAHAVVLTGEGEPDLPLHDLHTLRATITADLRHLDLSRPVHAFSGIGRPEKFFTSLEANGVAVKGRTPFPDHHPFTDRDVAALRETARESRHMLVTTEKDYARLNRMQRRGITPVPASISVTPEDAVDVLLDKVLST